MPLGELIYENKGKVKGQRVLDIERTKIEHRSQLVESWKGLMIQKCGHIGIQSPDGMFCGERP